MNKLKETLKTQQQINEAVQSCIDYFNANDDYVDHMERMLNAQTQIIGIMEIAKREMSGPNGNSLFCQSEDIIYFLYDVQAYLNLLKPFARMAGAIGGEGGEE